MKRLHLNAITFILLLVIMFAGCSENRTEDNTDTANNFADTEPTEYVKDPETKAPSPMASEEALPAKPEEASPTEAEDAPQEPVILMEVRTEAIASSEGEEGKLVFRFLNDAKTIAKWGDSCYIRFPNGETMLIDAGIPDTGKVIAKYLEYFGVEKIDHLVVTHNHIDHIGGIPEIINSFEVVNLYSTVYGKWASQNEEAASKITGKRYYLTRGDSLDFGGVHVDILNPSFSTEVYRRLNDEDMPKREKTILTNLNSLVMKFTYGDSTALFAADIYADTEQELEKEYGTTLKADLLKIPHHGQGTSSTREFVNAVSPEVAVATGGENLTLFHYSIYQQAGTDIYHSVFDGCVKVVMDKTGILEVISEIDRTEAYIYK